MAYTIHEAYIQRCNSYVCFSIVDFALKYLQSLLIKNIWITHLKCSSQSFCTFEVEHVFSLQMLDHFI